MTDTILVGIDGSQESRNGLDYGIAQAKANQANLIIAFVIEWSQYSFNTPEENEERHQRREEEIQMAHERVLDPILKSLEAEGLKITGIVRHGQVADVLLQIGKEHGAGHIIVGRIGQRGIKAMIFGSVVSKLIQLTRIPVTIVP